MLPCYRYGHHGGCTRRQTPEQFPPGLLTREPPGARYAIATDSLSIPFPLLQFMDGPELHEDRPVLSWWKAETQAASSYPNSGMAFLRCTQTRSAATKTPPPGIKGAGSSATHCPSGCGTMARRARLRFTATPNQWLKVARPVPARGAYRDRHERGTGCGGRESVGAPRGRRAG